jgi:hypothetical protein
MTMHGGAIAEWVVVGEHSRLFEAVERAVRQAGRQAGRQG